jgi:hypothetical protein
MTNCPYGFRVVGDCKSKRRLVDAEAAFVAHSHCDPRCELNTESYLSAFRFNSQFADYLTEHGTTKGFDGVCWSAWLWFDIDRDNLEVAKADTISVIDRLKIIYEIDPTDLLIWFSGGKGFHIGVSLAWKPAASRQFNAVAKRVAETIAGGIVIDAGIYDKVRLWRSPNSRHAKTGLYKTRLTAKELTTWTIAEIKQAAQTPKPFSIPTGKESQLLRELWDSTTKNMLLVAASRQPSELNTHTEVVGHRLNQLTTDFIANGAGVGDRHRLLFSAAANLAEFGCRRPLAVALLMPSALNSGLSPAEAERQIDCGLAKGEI